MDDLSFRKAVYADPFTKDPEVIEAAKNDAEKQRFWEEIRLMESQLQEAMNIPVPDNLAEKLILRQSIKQHKVKQKQRPWYLAMAASVALVSIISFGVMNVSNSNLTHDVLAHMDHLNAEMAKSSVVNIEQLNAKLDSFNGKVISNSDLGEVVSANYCYLSTIKSLHLVIKGENGFTSLFVVPESISDSIASGFKDATYVGASFLIESAKIIVVGEDPSDVEDISEIAKKNLRFSA